MKRIMQKKQFCHCGQWYCYERVSYDTAIEKLCAKYTIMVLGSNLNIEDDDDRRCGTEVRKVAEIDSAIQHQKQYYGLCGEPCFYAY